MRYAHACSTSRALLAVWGPGHGAAHALCCCILGSTTQPPCLCGSITKAALACVSGFRVFLVFLSLLRRAFTLTRRAVKTHCFRALNFEFRSLNLLFNNTDISLAFCSTTAECT
jgi:hypothetical protein